MSNISFKKLVPVIQMQGDSEPETKLLQQMLKEAETYLLSFEWCKSIVESYFGLGIGEVVAVFLFRIVPAKKGVDEWLWVVVGDLPPAYLVIDSNSTPLQALKAYVEEMQAWVVAVETGKSINDLIPVDVSPTRDNAKQLKQRLVFLKTKIMPRYEE